MGTTASMYPNIAIANRTFPFHLGEEFCVIYKDVYDQRVMLKKAGKDAEQQMMKLALNGVYGDSNNRYSPFYDPQYTMTITVNGQLSLCMLSEMFMTVEDLSIIQVNTDGVTAKFKRKDFDRVRELYKQWEKISGLELEEAIYDKMIIRDVNNYIAVYEGGEKVKRKGVYEYENLGWHQNHSSLVIPKAAEHALVYGGSVSEFIRSHKNKYDFMLRTKVPRSSRLELRNESGSVEKLQNICRYYISESSDKLVKVMPPIPKNNEKYWKGEFGEYVTHTDTDIKNMLKNDPECVQLKITYEQALSNPTLFKQMERDIGIDTSWNVSVCNDMKSFKGLDDINYDYYIEEANKLVECIVKGDISEGW